MEIISLGKADGLPPVDWAVVAEKLAMLPGWRAPTGRGRPGCKRG
jgi:hypothetical protein